MPGKALLENSTPAVTASHVLGAEQSNSSMLFENKFYLKLYHQLQDGVNPDILLKSGYGHRLHIWDLPRRRHVQALELGPEHQMALELRPAHDPTRAYGFLGVVVSLKDLSASIWVWSRDNGAWGIRKIIEIPAEPADPEKLPPILKGFKAVAPLITDINLSLDDRFLYVSCWGTGDLRQYDVSDPFNPKLTGKVRIGGIVSRASHPAASGSLNGGPQMVEVSRDGRRVYLTTSLFAAWARQCFPGRTRTFASPPGVSTATDAPSAASHGVSRSSAVMLRPSTR